MVRIDWMSFFFKLWNYTFEFLHSMANNNHNEVLIDVFSFFCSLKENWVKDEKRSYIERNRWNGPFDYCAIGRIDCSSESRLVLGDILLIERPFIVDRSSSSVNEMIITAILSDDYGKRGRGPMGRSVLRSRLGAPFYSLLGNVGGQDCSWAPISPWFVLAGSKPEMAM